MDTMDKPKHKYWKVNRNDVGREVGNPDYVAWSAWKINRLEAENARLEREKAELVEALGKALDKHRDEAYITCPEDCWCWDIEGIFIKYSESLAKHGGE